MKLGLSALHKLVCTMPAPTLSCLRRHFDVFLVQNMEEKYEYGQRQEYFKRHYFTVNTEKESSPSFCVSQGCSCTLQYPPRLFLYSR